MYIFVIHKTARFIFRFVDKSAYALHYVLNTIFYMHI